MKRILSVLAIIALVVSPVLAQGKAAPAKDAGKDLTLTGKITKETVEEKVTFTLVTADEKIALPALTKEQEALVDVDVTVVVKGKVAEVEGKKVTTVEKIVSVKKVEAKKGEPKKAEPKKEEPKKAEPAAE
jgi:hypothetical protein